MSSFFPGSHTVSFNGSSSGVYHSSHRRDSNVDPYSRTSSSNHRSSSSRYGDRSGYQGPAGYRYHRSRSRDAVAGAERREPERDSRRDNDGYEDAYSRFARERAEEDRRYSGYNRSREERRSSNYDRDREHDTRRGATAGLSDSDGRGSPYGYGVERESNSYRFRRDSEAQASGGARQGERSGSAAAADWSDYRRSSTDGRHAFSPSEYYKYH